jgi:hypothetical protein
MFRFTIRDVLWLMVVVGLVLGWLMEHRHAAKTSAEVQSLRAWQQGIKAALKERRIGIRSPGPRGSFD